MELQFKLNRKTIHSIYISSVPSVSLQDSPWKPSISTAGVFSRIHIKIGIYGCFGGTETCMPIINSKWIRPIIIRRVTNGTHSHVYYLSSFHLQFVALLKKVQIFESSDTNLSAQIRWGFSQIKYQMNHRCLGYFAGHKREFWHHWSSTVTRRYGHKCYCLRITRNHFVRIPSSLISGLKNLNFETPNSHSSGFAFNPDSRINPNTFSNRVLCTVLDYPYTKHHPFKPQYRYKVFLRRLWKVAGLYTDEKRLKQNWAIFV